MAVEFPLDCGNVDAEVEQDAHLADGPYRVGVVGRAYLDTGVSGSYVPEAMRRLASPTRMTVLAIRSSATSGRRHAPLFVTLRDAPSAA